MSQRISLRAWKVFSGASFTPLSREGVRAAGSGVTARAGCMSVNLGNYPLLSKFLAGVFTCFRLDKSLKRRLSAARGNQKRLSFKGLKKVVVIPQPHCRASPALLSFAVEIMSTLLSNTKFTKILIYVILNS